MCLSALFDIRLFFSPTSDGSGCAILASEDFVRKHGLEHQAVEIIGQAMATDLPSTFNDKSCIKVYNCLDYNRIIRHLKLQQCVVIL